MSYLWQSRNNAMTNRLMMADARRLVERAYPEDQEAVEPWPCVEPEPYIRVVTHVARPVERDARLLGVVAVSMLMALILFILAPFWGPAAERVLPR